MNQGQRRLFYSSLIILFLVITPLILLYAAGYNFRLFERKIVNTGLLIVNSFPSGGDIYLNGQWTKNRTPARFPNLKPGIYLIEIKKTGYKPWQKKLNVYAHYTTFADQAILFKNNPRPELLIKESVLFAKASPDKQEIAMLTKTGQEQSLSIVNPLKNTKRIVKAGIRAEVEDISWEKNYIFLKLKKENKLDWIIFDPAHQTEAQISQLTILSFEKLRAGSLGRIYGLAEDVIYEIDLTSKKIQALSQQPAIDFLVKNNDLYYLTDQEKKEGMLKIDLSKKTVTPVINANNSYQSFWDISSDNYFLLINTQSFCLYIIDQGKNEVCFPHKIKGAILSPDREKILYFNESEMFVYYVLKSEENLITRQGKKINNVVWYPNSEYLVYNDNESIQAIEIDKRDKVNNYLLFEGQGEIICVPSGEDIILSTKRGQNSSVYLYDLTIR